MANQKSCHETYCSNTERTPYIVRTMNNSPKEQLSQEQRRQEPERQTEEPIAPINQIVQRFDIKTQQTWNDVQNHHRHKDTFGISEQELLERPREIGAIACEHEEGRHEEDRIGNVRIV